MQRLHLSPVRMVRRLFFGGCPSTVRGLVVAIIVEPINLMQARRAMSHVGDERIKRIAPPLTDSDAPAAVSVPLLGVRIRAALDHSLPKVVERLAGAVLSHIVGLAHVQFELGLSAAYRRACALVLSLGFVCRTAALLTAIVKDAQSRRALTGALTTVDGACAHV